VQETDRLDLYAPVEPYDQGMLDVGDGNAIAWEIAGARDGKPAVVLHGGPGQGCSPNISVTTSRRAEADWLYGGLRRFFPEAWERFRQHAHDDHVIAGYARHMEDPDAMVRLAAARAWCAWEDVALSLEPARSGYGDLKPDEMLALVRICTHYLRHGAWLEEGALIRDAGRLAGIPAVLIHGRRDLSCPIDTAWELARAWPGATLVDVADAGHLATPTKRAALLRAIDEFAPR
jgi:proline iminopeptidase